MFPALFTPHPGLERGPDLNAPPGIAAEERSFALQTLEAPPPSQVTYPFACAEGQEHCITLSAQPVLNLARQAIVGAWICEDIRVAATSRRLRRAERGRLEKSDVERLDCEVYRRGISLLAESRAQTGLLPVSYRTLACAHGRFALTSACQQASATGRAILFAELLDVDPDTAPDRLVDVLARLGAERRGVMVRAPRTGMSLPLLAATARPLISGISFDAGGTDGVPPQDWPAFAAVIGAARTIASTIMVERLDPKRASAAREAGVTHAVFAPLAPMWV